LRSDVLADLSGDGEWRAEGRGLARRQDEIVRSGVMASRQFEE